MKDYFMFSRRINRLKSFRNFSRVSFDMKAEIWGISYFSINRVDREILARVKKMPVCLLHHQALKSMGV
jgi:hypothetical protein